MKQSISKKFKLKIISIIIFLTVLSILYFSVAALASSGFFVIETMPETPEYYFYDADFGYDIFEDEEYLELISYKFITYDDGYHRTNLTEDDYEFCSDPVRLVIDLVLAAQSGDAEGYNACLSPAFKNKEGKHRDFTMQQIYDVVITEGDTVKVGNYHRTDIKLEYKIHKNNGTFRSDMESDLVKEQYLAITTNNADKAFLIDSITTKNYIYKDQIAEIRYNFTNIITVTCVSAVIIAGAIVGIIIVFKKTKISDATE